MSHFKCDCKEFCRHKPYAEIYYPSTEEEEGKWFYACFYHLLVLKIKRFFGKTKPFGWCKVDTDRETLERILDEIYSIQSDLWDIKEEMGLNEEVSFDDFGVYQ